MNILTIFTHYRGNDKSPATLAHARATQAKAAGPALSPLEAVPALAAEAEPVADPAVPDVAVADAATKPTRLVGSGHLSMLSAVTISLFALVGAK